MPSKNKSYHQKSFFSFLSRTAFRATNNFSIITSIRFRAHVQKLENKKLKTQKFYHLTCLKPKASRTHLELLHQQQYRISKLDFRTVDLGFLISERNLGITIKHRIEKSQILKI